jgi:hypothetical protein
LSKPNGINISLQFHTHVPKQRRNKIPFNPLARAALNAGSDFFVRINDDTEFISNSWITKGINALESLNPRYVGVVGPDCPDGNTQILTHDMVHHTHLRIFGEYYPDVFESIFVDNWISSVTEVIELFEYCLPVLDRTTSCLYMNESS